MSRRVLSAMTLKMSAMRKACQRGAGATNCAAHRKTPVVARAPAAAPAAPPDPGAGNRVR